MANFAVLGGAARVLSDSLKATKKKIDTVKQNSTKDTEPTWLKYAPSMNDGENSVSSANDYYDDLLKSQQTAVNEQTQSALDANNAYIPKVNQYQDKRLQDAYILKEQNRVNLPQQLSALGYSGGATETSMLGEMTDYQNSRNDIETDRNDALNSIYQNAAQIRSTGNANLADISAQYYQNLIAKQQSDAANAASSAQWQTEYNTEAEQTAYENKVALAKLKAQYGDYSGLQELGISTASLVDGSTPVTSKKTATKTTTTTPTSSGNYNTVLNNVKRALGGSNAGSQRSWDAAINYIQSSLKNGTITEYEANQMINQLGLS